MISPHIDWAVRRVDGHDALDLEGEAYLAV